MGHGAEHHTEHNPGTGYYKGHDPGTEHDRGHDHDVKHFNGHDSGTENQKDHCHVNRKKEKNHDELVGENLSAVTETVTSLGNTIDMLIQKSTSMAYHIIAVEEILAELVAANGLDIALVNARIRERIVVGTDNQSNPDKALDVAASIASLQAR